MFEIFNLILQILQIAMVLLLVLGFVFALGISSMTFKKGAK